MRRKRIIYIDVIRVVAMIAVVFAHTCSSVLIKGPSAPLWTPANILVTITEIAVPLFYMISGATILNSSKTKDLNYLFKHRLIRILIPFLAWSIISAFFFQLINNGPHFQQAIHNISLLYHQPVLTAFWFIYPLIGFYLVSPALKAFVDNVSKSTINYILILWFITNIFLPNLSKSLPPQYGQYFEAYGFASLIFLSKMIGYFILGYKLSNITAEKINLKLNLSIFIVGTLLAIINMYVISRYALQTKPLAGFLTPVLLPFLAGTSFLCLKKFESNYSMRFQSIIESIAPLTYGIYLSHGIIIELVSHVIDPMNYFGVFSVSIVVCLVLMWALSNIPFVNKYLM